MLASYKELSFPIIAMGTKEFLGMSFFYSGYLYRNIRNRVCIPSKYTYLFVILGLIFITIGERYWQSTLLSMVWWKVVPYYLTAIVGTMVVYVISKAINQISDSNRIKRFLIYTGDNTLTILTWHLLCFKLVSLIIIAAYGLPINQLAEFPTIVAYSQQGWFILYLFIGIAIPMMFSKVQFLK